MIITCEGCGGKFIHFCPHKKMTGKQRKRFCEDCIRVRNYKRKGQKLMGNKGASDMFAIMFFLLVNVLFFAWTTTNYHKTSQGVYAYEGKLNQNRLIEQIPERMK